MSEHQNSEAEIRGFFADYARAFTALDVGGILDHFAFPCQIATETSGYAFADRAAIEADMAGFVGFYAEQAFERAELKRLEVQPLSDAFALAHVNWWLVQRGGAVLVDINSTYILRTGAGLGAGDSAPRIIGILGHNEDSKWQQRNGHDAKPGDDGRGETR
jgi:hypothetical protein